MEERFGEGHDASPQKILKFGRKFLKEFKSEREANGNIRIDTNVSGHESPVCISLVYRKERIKHTIGRIKIGFTADGIVIEAIQGIKTESVKEANDILQQPWPNRIIQAIEKNARKQGMKRIYLKDPATMYWFNNPLTGHELGSGAHEEAAEHVRRTMKNFYGIIAKRNGFKRATNGFFIKELQ